MQKDTTRLLCLCYFQQLSICPHSPALSYRQFSFELLFIFQIFLIGSFMNWLPCALYFFKYSCLPLRFVINLHNCHLASYGNWLKFSCDCKHLFHSRHLRQSSGYFKGFSAHFRHSSGYFMDFPHLSIADLLLSITAEYVLQSIHHNSSVTGRK